MPPRSSKNPMMKGLADRASSPRVAQRLIATMTLFVVILLGVACREGSVFAEIDRARALTAEARLRLSQADDASNRAVMADSDEASIAFAHDAEEATRELGRSLAELGSLLRKLRLSQEIRTFDEFQGQWSKYQTLDKEILTLAVENTNLKAQALSFGSARETADALRASLEKTVAGVPGKDRCRADSLVATATLAVREIQVVQARHIAERTDPVMTQLEQQMRGLGTQARDALGALRALAPAAAQLDLTTSVSALDRFEEIAARIIALSRRNTNVRSFELALRQKPALSTACEQSLEALQQALAQEGSKATR